MDFFIKHIIVWQNWTTNWLKTLISPRCTFNGLGDMKMSHVEEWILKKTSSSGRRLGQCAPHVRWCMICMYFLNMFCVCQLCKTLSVISKHSFGNDNKTILSKIVFLFLNTCHKLFDNPRIWSCGRASNSLPFNHAF